MKHGKRLGKILCVTSCVLFDRGLVMAHELGPLSATVELEPKSGSQVQGTLHLTQHGDQVMVTGEVYGLLVGLHGIHVHTNGNCDSPDGESAGNVFNPDGQPRKQGSSGLYPLGDIGNIEAKSEGRSAVNMTIYNATISIVGLKSIADKTLVIFEKADDGSEPNGNSSKRIGCGYIDLDMSRM